MTHPDGERAATLRTNAPQRMPHAPATPWGRLRRLTGWSLRELADRSRVNAAELSRIERGIGPTPSRARRLLEVYDAALGPMVVGE